MESKSAIFARSGLVTIAPVSSRNTVPVDAVQFVRAPCGQRREQFRHGGFPFAHDDHIGPEGQIFVWGNWPIPEPPRTTVQP